MAAIVPTNTPRRHDIGDLIARVYVMPAAVNNGDTLTVPQGSILTAVITPTTSTAVGCTIAGNVITFASGGAWTGRVLVISRVG